MKKLLLSSAITVVLASGYFSTARAQHIAGSAGEKTDAYIRLMIAKKPIPGVSVAVLKDGKVLKMQSYGLANIETNSPATSQSVYKLASLSKQFIAAAVMLLQQSGQIDLDSSINKYLDSLPTAWQSISVRNLLTHTSGLIRDLPDWDPLKVRPLSEDIKTIYPLPLDFAPGTQFDYSNMNYFVLAAIIEKVTGTNWADWISRHIFTPSGMSQTRTCSMTDLAPNRVNGYEKISTGWKNADIWLALWPSSAFLSSVTDLAKWDNMLWSDKLLTVKSKNQMWTAAKLNDGKAIHYGLGWFIDSVNNHLRVHHDGGVPGFRSDFERYPDDKLSVIVLTNSGGANAERMAQNIAGFFMPVLKPAAPKALPEKEPEIKTIVKGFINGLQQHSAIDTGTLAADIAKRYNKDAVRSMADAMRGKIYALTLINRREKNGRRTYRYRLDYGYDYMDLIIQFDSLNKISGYGFDD